MAKYTDPNTGVKYSTHTGLKVFTVIVVILLVISVILNAVLFVQSSDDSVVDSSEGGELDGGYGDGEDGDGHKDDDGGSLEDGSNDGVLPGEGGAGDEGDYESGEGEDTDDGDDDSDSSESSSGRPPVDESIVDTVTVIENENTVRTSDFNEHGIATCLYYYPDKTFLLEDGSTYIGCGLCEGPCQGHEYYISKGGAVYDWTSFGGEPDVIPQVLEAEDGFTDINSEIRVSLVFKGYPEDEFGYSKYVKYTDYYYNDIPHNIEITSLTGEALEIESVELKQYVYYDSTFTGLSIVYTEYHSKKGIDCNLKAGSGTLIYPDVTTKYSLDVDYDGEFIFTLTLSDGNSYSFEFWCIGNPDNMIGAQIVCVD